MRATNKLLGAVAVLALSAAFAAPAMAADPPSTVFAQYQADSGRDGHPGSIVWLRADSDTPAGFDDIEGHAGGYLFSSSQDLYMGAPNTAFPDSLGVLDAFFTYHSPLVDVPFTALQASFLLQGTSTEAATCSTVLCNTSSAFITQAGINGTFSFTYTGSGTFMAGGHTYGFGTNLLSGTFTGADITGRRGTNNGTFFGMDDAPTLNFSNIVFTSDVLTFSNTSDDQISMDMGAGAFPGLFWQGTGYGLSNYNAPGTGSFSSTPTPTTNVVPEPTTWALMIMGFGAAGAMFRRRRHAMLTA